MNKERHLNIIQFQVALESSLIKSLLPHLDHRAEEIFLGFDKDEEFDEIIEIIISEINDYLDKKLKNK